MAASRKVESTKLDAAHRQLRTALDLWFSDADPVSIHTLAAASHEIIHKLFRAKGLKHLMFDSPLIPQELRGEIAKGFKADAAFFKHSNKSDPSESHIFDPARNDMFLLYSVFALDQMGEKISDVESAYIHWHCFKRPDLLSQNARKKITDAMNVEQLTKITSMEKNDFLSQFLSQSAIKRASRDVR